MSTDNLQRFSFQVYKSAKNIKRSDNDTNAFYGTFSGIPYIQDSDNNTLKIQEYHIVYSEFVHYGGFTTQRLVYEKSDSIHTPISFQIIIHDSNQPPPFRFPALYGQGLIVLAIFLLFLGVIFILVFIWYCWSVRYYIIKKFITQPIKNTVPY